MPQLTLQSKLKKVKDIPWDQTIFVDKIVVDSNLLKIHRERIDKVFSNASQEIKEQQLQNILLRDTLFNKAMDLIANCYSFEIYPQDINFFLPPLRTNIPEIPNTTPEQYEQRLQEIATKLVQKQLIFNDIATTFSIDVSSDEMLSVLDEYHKSTGLPIDDIKSDKEKLTGAVSALLEEKITAFIINKFPKNLDALYENMQKDLEQFKKFQEENKNNKE